MTLMRALPIKALRAITIVTKDLVTFRIIIFYQPTVETTTPDSMTEYFKSVFVSSTVNMINDKKLDLTFATTGTFRWTSAIML